MLNDTDDYRKPLITANPPKKGLVVGARIAGKVAGLPELQADWNVLPAGESREIAAGTLLHVKGPGKRLHSFWFDETGSVCGPMWFSTVEAAVPERGSAPPDRRRFIHAALVATLGMLGVVALVQEPITVLGRFAPSELFVSLLIGWVLTLAWCFQCTRGQHRVRSKITTVAPPRSSLVQHRLLAPNQI